MQHNRIMNIREEIAHVIAQAIDGSMNYTGDKRTQNAHNWTQIATDRVMGAVVEFMPKPVDIVNKYELDPQKGLYVSIQTENTPESFKKNQEQMFHVARFADDQGYNRYWTDMMDVLSEPYKPLQQPGIFANISTEGEISEEAI